MAIAFRGLFYFAAKGLWKSGLKGQHRVPSGVKRVRLFQMSSNADTPNRAMTIFGKLFISLSLFCLFVVKC